MKNKERDFQYQHFRDKSKISQDSYRVTMKTGIPSEMDVVNSEIRFREIIV